jgi:K+-transporting ATPase c subunit
VRQVLGAISAFDKAFEQLARQRACTLFDELRRKQMKIMITIIVTFIIVAIFQAPTSAVAQRTLAYDSQGNFSGTATTRGNVGTTYDHHGRFESRAINRDGSRFTVRAVWHGNTQLIYNSNGQLIRKTVRHSDGTATFYDANGNIVGSSRK